MLVTYKDEYWWVKAHYHPEMKKDKMNKMIIIMQRDIYLAMCSCPVGKVQMCLDTICIGASYYALANFCSGGHLTDFITCTDVIQEWNKSCPKKHKPI